MARPPIQSAGSSRHVFLMSALVLSALIPALGIPVYFRTDDVHWLGWAIDHGNPLEAFDPGKNLFGYYRPVPTILWWVLHRLFGFQPLGYQLVLGLVAVLAMVPLYRIGRRLGGGDWAGLLAVILFHVGFFGILYYVYWFSALTFAVELLFLLAALDAFTDGTTYPARPFAFTVLALLAGLSKQPALVILPVIGIYLLLSGRRPAAAPGRLFWILAIGGVSCLLLSVTPFVLKRPGALSGLPGAEFLGYVAERFRFYAGQIVRSPAGPLVLGAAGAALGERLKLRPSTRWAAFVLGALAGVLLAKADPGVAFAFWASATLLGAWSLPESRPWVIGFWVPFLLLFGVDFHVATYLLEPAAILTPALALWVVPLLRPAAEVLRAKIDRAVPAPAGILLPLVLGGIIVSVAWSRIPPLVTMRAVRATFREGVETLITKAPSNAVVGSLSYDELGETYAEIRKRPLETRVEQHKTMNPAQLEKFLRLRGRGDLKVRAVREARDLPPPRLLFATSMDEMELMESLTGASSVAVFQRDGVSAGLFEWNPEGDSSGVRP